MNPSPFAIGESFREWADKARAFAHDHVLPPVGPKPPLHYADTLKWKYRVEGWATAVTVWYYVHPAKGGEVWRHLEVQTSIFSRGDEEPITQATLNAYPQVFLEAIEPLARVLFPLHRDFRFQARAETPIPVKNPETLQVSFRTPIVFHVLVPHDDARAGLHGTPATDGRRGLVDASGSPVEFEEADEAETFENVATGPQRNVLIFPQAEGDEPSEN